MGMGLDVKWHPIFSFYKRCGDRPIRVVHKHYQFKKSYGIDLSVGFAVSGHTQAAETLPLLPLWIVPHTLIAGYWIWAPVTLWPKDTDADDNIALKADRFSRIAIWAVPFLFVSGLYLFWRLNGSFWNSGTTLYGRLLLGKLAAALLLLGLGAYNKFRIAGLLHRDPQKGRAALRLSLRGEAVLFSVVILCVLFATTVTGPEGHHHYLLRLVIYTLYRYYVYTL